MDYLYLIYLAVVLATFVTGVIRFAAFDMGGKAMCVYTGIVCITEFLAYYCAVKFRNNLPVYSISFTIQMAAISGYFNFSVEYFTRRHLGIWIGVLSAILGIANVVFFQPINTLPTYFLIYMGVATTSMCMFAFYRKLIEEDSRHPSSDPHFWIMSIFVFFWSATLLNWGVYNYLAEHAALKMQWINLLLICVNIITYSAFCTVFLKYPKLRAS